MGRSITRQGIVKSVQRGVASGNQTITISAVDVSRTIVLINGGQSANVNTTSDGRVPRLSALTTTSFTVERATFSTTLSNDTNVDWSWQVVEYAE
jgi:hypothetical protein